MSIITISRGSYSNGKEIAEKVAKKLGYECTSRESYLEASEHFNVPEIKLVRAIHDAPSILDRFSIQKDKFVAYFQAAMLNHMRHDNVVYHGLAGHIFLRGISHVLKVRVVADMEKRVANEMKREKISEVEARRILIEDDKQRRKWSRNLYRINTADPRLYDLVININRLTIDDAVDLICSTVKSEKFRTTPESQKVIDDLWLAAEVKTHLLDLRPDVRVTANDGIVTVTTKAHISQEQVLVNALTKASRGIPGVEEIRVDVIPL